jgi:thioredoxin reductase (NADPH)
VATLYETRRGQMFPKLTPIQLSRLEAYGQRGRTREGDVLVESGARYRSIVAVLSGSVDIVRSSLAGEAAVTMLTDGDFSGEMSALRGSASYVRIRVREAGEAITIPVDNLRRLVQADAELSEIFMRAFILRRMALMESEQGDVIFIGVANSSSTLRVRQFLGRNAVPYVSLDADADGDAAALLEQFRVARDELPVVLCRGKILSNPDNESLAECLAMNPEIDESLVRDMIVIGAGPAGLAAAVYAASEGLRVLALETVAPGGQAGSSSKIENYLGFPTGISGQALAGRALVQAQKFGTEVVVAGSALRLHPHERPYRIDFSRERSVRGRTIIIATGAEYRRLPIENLDRLLGIGVYYAATHLEAQLCKGEEVCIIGGGNSAGQAAVFLAGVCSRVYILVRSSGLADTMSQYLVRRIEDSPNISLNPWTELTSLAGDSHLESVSWRSREGEMTRSIRHVFLMTGAVPNTSWLGKCIAADSRGFLLTGPDLRRDDLEARKWPLKRAPYFLETSVPGVFAVGDVRSGSLKRVAAAVGEGAASVSFVHAALRD